MKKLLLSLLITSISIISSAQLFSIEQNITFKDGAGNNLRLALAGGLNQPQFSSIDLNFDGILDLFVFDRTGGKVLTFLATQDGQDIVYIYAPEYEAYFPYTSSEYMEVTDYNNDGLPDLWFQGSSTVQLCKNTSSNQELKFGNPKGLRSYVFSNPPFDTGNISQFSGNYPDIVDIDNDGDIDYLTNIDYTATQIALYLNNTEELDKNINDIDFERPDLCFGNIGEAGAEIVLNVPCGYYRYYRYKKKHAGVKTLTFFDNDNDGDLDLFLGTSESLTHPLIFLENGKTDLGHPRDTFISVDTAYFSSDIMAQIPVVSAAHLVDLDNDGVRDLILSCNQVNTNDYAVKQTKNVLYFYNKGTNTNPDWEFQDNSFLNGEMVDLGGYTSPTLVDIDGDEDLDLVVATNGDHYLSGDKQYNLVLFENTGSKTSPSFELVDSDFANTKVDSNILARPAFADIDGDDDLDLFIGKSNGTITFYENTGSATSASFSRITKNYENIKVSGAASPAFYDIDNNGTLDLFIGEFDGFIEYHKNTGSKSAASFTLQDDEFGGIRVNEKVLTKLYDPVQMKLVDSLVTIKSGYSSLGFAKLGNDSMAIITGGNDGKIKAYNINNDLSADFSLSNELIYHSMKNEYYIKDWGSQSQPAVGDLNNDGYSDIIIGNNRGGLTFMEGKELASINTLKLNIDNLIKVYPNPASDVLHLSFEIPVNNYAYKIYDLSGRLIQANAFTNDRQIALSSNIESGAYFIRLDLDGFGYSTHKFMVSK